MQRAAVGGDPEGVELEEPGLFRHQRVGNGHRSGGLPGGRRDLQGVRHHVADVRRKQAGGVTPRGVGRRQRKRESIRERQRLHLGDPAYLDVQREPLARLHLRGLQVRPRDRFLGREGARDHRCRGHRGGQDPGLRQHSRRSAPPPPRPLAHSHLDHCYQSFLGWRPRACAAFRLTSPGSSVIACRRRSACSGVICGVRPPSPS